MDNRNFLCEIYSIFQLNYKETIEQIVIDFSHRWIDMLIYKVYKNKNSILRERIKNKYIFLYIYDIFFQKIITCFIIIIYLFLI